MSMNWPVYWLAEIDSTNEEARRRALSTGVASQWIAARRQVSGRGRLGRVWASPEGNLYSTALFTWDGPVAEMTRIPFAAALAVADTVSALAPGSQPKLKWPNDVRCDGAKVSGILIEAGEANGVRWVAAGIGVNVGFVPEGVDQAATSLTDLRGDALVTVDTALEALRETFAKRLGEAKRGFAETRAAWLERAEALGEVITINAGGTRTRGIFRDMAMDGALLLELPDGTVSPIRAGDVELIREVGPE